MKIRVFILGVNMSYFRVQELLSQLSIVQTAVS